MVVTYFDSFVKMLSKNTRAISQVFERGFCNITSCGTFEEG